MKRFTYILIIVLLVLGVESLPVSAEAAIPFTVSAVIPENQIDNNLSYFDLKVNSGHMQDISIAVRNQSDKTIRVHVIPKNGTTSSTGVIDYSGSGLLLDGPALFRFTEICAPAQLVELLPHESKLVHFTMTIPDGSLDGTVLGGFLISEEEDETVLPEESKENGIQIRNRFSYVLGVKLRENLIDPVPDFRLGKIEPSKWNARFALAVDLEMPVSTIVSGYSLSGQLLCAKTGEVIHSFKRESFSMAPISIYRIHENLSSDSLPGGDYLMRLQILNGEERWELEKEFSVSEIQKQLTIAGTIEGRNARLILVLGVIVVLLITLIAIYVVFRICKMKKAAHDARRKSTKG